jgi:hypothetical protein
MIHAQDLLNGRNAPELGPAKERILLQPSAMLVTLDELEDMEIPPSRAILEKAGIYACNAGE